MYEASDGPGGRIRTDVIDGFRIDRGFQVYFQAYPHARLEFDLKPLDMKSYRPGALIFTGHGLKRLDLHRPFESLLSSAFPFGDKLRLGLLVARNLLGHGFPERTTEQFLRESGFSEVTLQRFFRPFFGGIFLDPSLDTSSSQFAFLLQALVRGKVSTPALGMGMLTQQVADDLPPGSINYNSQVVRVSSEGVVFADGKTVETDRVVLACDPPSTSALLREEYFNKSVSSTTLYFQSPQPPVDEPIIVLNGTGEGIVNLVAPLSVVSPLLAPALAPAGRHLVAVTTFSPPPVDALIDRVKEECQPWFPGRNVHEWRHLRTVHVPFAQYRQAPGFRQERPSCKTTTPHVYRGGEMLTNSSIDGACQAGQLVAKEICRELVTDLPL